MTSSEVRPIDQARASRMVMASITGDSLMFSATVQETLDDDYGFGELGSLVNVLRTLADDLGGAVVDRYGTEQAADLVRATVVQFTQQAESPNER
jgi:hypothetical protein